MRTGPEDVRSHRRAAAAWGLAVGLFGILAWIVFVKDDTMFDLRIYREAAQALLDHRAIYDLRYGTWRLRFTYPPFALVPLLPLTALPWTAATTAWFAGQIACLMVSTRICLASVGERATWARAALIAGAAALVLHPVRSTVDFGQLNVVLLLLILLDAFVVRGRWRGVAVGIASAVKLTPLAFVPWFVAARDRRSALRATATFVACTLATWVVLPAASGTYWLRESRDPGRIGVPGDPLNQSWNGSTIRILGEGFPASTAWILLAALSLIAGLIAARRLHDRGLELASLCAVGVAALLASPISWPHHWVWSLPAAIAGWAGRAERPWLWRATVLLLIATATTPWTVTGLPPARDAYVVAGAVWLLAAIAEGRGDIRRPGPPEEPQEQPLVLPHVEQT